ncbi:MAG: phosphatidylserine decarboxylase [Ectothiorhodospiraceae bacterium]|nr:phosphatidylserine decarboxylase [Ectothiorhodospiraceae bacterium]
MNNRLGRYLEEAPSTSDWLKTLPLYPLPHHVVSRLIHRLVRVRAGWFRRPFVSWFVRAFGVDMSQAVETDPLAYPDFNSFFTRALRADARPMPEDAAAICCPADGTVSALGELRGDSIIQAKGHDYSLTTLLGGDPDRARPFLGGGFITVYLSPRDYHRVHMPLGGTLREMVHVPGRLFSVGRHTVKTVPGLFARNERVACLFDTDHGPMALVLVGAINVASIETVWAGEVTPPRGRSIRCWSYENGSIRLDRGEEMGRFNMGSTAIVILPRGMAELDPALQADQPVRVRQAIGRLMRP